MNRTILKGLSPETREKMAGENKIVGQQITISVFNDGRDPIYFKPVAIIEPTIKRQNYGDYRTESGNVINLKRYLAKGIFDEFIQKTVRKDDDEFVFLALKDRETGYPVIDSFWTDKEIEDAIEDPDEIGPISPS